jgi:hypothetical protein
MIRMISWLVCVLSSLCVLWVLCVSGVLLLLAPVHHGGTENTETAPSLFSFETISLRYHSIMTNQTRVLPSLSRAVAIGGVGFGLASLCVFATVAYAERWLYLNLGLWGAYLLWTALFILLGGAVLGSLVVGRWRLPKFYLLYGIAFFAYAVGWVGAYFTLRGTAGEWVGSVAGSVLMALVFAVGLGAVRKILKLSPILFITNSLGYFTGSALNDYVGGKGGMLIWGISYGLCLGAGIGAVLHLAQVSGERSA